jgi:hypothetical protein
MRTSGRFAVAFILSLGAFAAPPRAAEEIPKNLMTDDGRLDVAWFGAQAPDFHRCEGDRCKLGKDEVSYDYLWVKPGFDLKGHTLLMKPWEAGAFRGDAKREPDEIKHGATITAGAVDELVKPLNKGYKGVATVSATEGDWVITARVVDSAGPFGFGFLRFSNTTYDLKINDKATGDLLLALHNRHITGKDVVEDFYESAAKFLALLKDANKLYDLGETLAVADARHKSEEAGGKKK